MYNNMYNNNDNNDNNSTPRQQQHQGQTWEQNWPALPPPHIIQQQQRQYRPRTSPEIRQVQIFES